MNPSPSQSKHLDPKLDVVFKALFGRQDSAKILTGMLNDLLRLSGADRIESVEVLSPVLELLSAAEKLAVVDLLVRDGRGRLYMVEMQCQNHHAFPERMLYYAARRYCEQIGRGKDYDSLQPVVLLVFTDFVLRPQLSNWLERFELRAQNDASVLFSGHLSVVLAQLPLLKKPASEASEPAEQWGNFLKEGTKMKTQTEDKPWLTPELRKAIAELEQLEGDRQMQEIYEARRREVALQATLLHEYYDEGLAKGRTETQEEIARRLLASGVTAELVASSTGLSLEALSSL